MSSQQVNQFLKEVSVNSEMRESLAQNVAQFSAQHGYQFTQDELQKTAEKLLNSDELSDQELEAVSAGVSKEDSDDNDDGTAAD